VQTFGSTAALATQTSIAVSTLSEATYTLQASYSGDDLYAPTCRNLPTGVDVALERRDAHDQPCCHRRELPSRHPGGSWVSIFGWGLANIADLGVNALAVGIANAS
jgi:hypothetical protein